MKLIISRTYHDNYTTGIIVVFDGDKILSKACSLELPWLNNQRNVSCVPEGEYWAIKEISPTRGKIFRLLYVHGRSGILFHKGNFVAGYVKDSEGCILPGTYFEDINGDGNLDVVESTKAMDALWDIMPDKFKVIII